MNTSLLILAAGMSSRMKASSSNQIEDKKLHQANTRSKGLIEIGPNSKPLIYYLLFNAQQAGYKTIYLITGKDSSLFRRIIQGFSDLDQLQIKFVTQNIPSTRAKPWGTADAVFQALEQFPNLKKEYFSVCNSDNLYSVKAFQNIREIEGGGALIAYDMDFLKFNKKKISGFALLVFDLNFNLQEIIEKPDPDDFKNYSDSKGSLYVSMNLFTFSGDQFYSFLKECPVHPSRNEKELPSAILNMVHTSPCSFIGIPMKEHVPDLTNKEDILHFENHLKDLDF
ncbi:MAG: sugar phosphate nucleotidyltransferase [Flavobacteriaceae bacterium]|nr:sugar phosphate nucleotidyltransferase [Flavobacteriaceae bacterium]